MGIYLQLFWRFINTLRSFTWWNKYVLNSTLVNLRTTNRNLNPSEYFTVLLFDLSDLKGIVSYCRVTGMRSEIRLIALTPSMSGSMLVVSDFVYNKLQPVKVVHWLK